MTRFPDSAYSPDLDAQRARTRPVEFGGLQVPDVLLSGHHADVRRWRKREALARTLARRPDLLEEAALDDEERALLEEIRGEDKS